MAVVSSQLSLSSYTFLLRHQSAFERKEGFLITASTSVNWYQCHPVPQIYNSPLYSMCQLHLVSDLTCILTPYHPSLAPLSHHFPTVCDLYNNSFTSFCLCKLTVHLMYLMCITKLNVLSHSILFLNFL